MNVSRASSSKSLMCDELIQSGLVDTARPTTALCKIAPRKMGKSTSAGACVFDPLWK